MAFDRDLLRGSLELMVLLSLARGERYGYQILATLRERSDGEVRLQAGTLYPILHKLEAEKLVRARWERGEGRRDRKWYSLTPAGQRRIEQRTSEWRRYVDCVQSLLQPHTGGSRRPQRGDAPRGTVSLGASGGEAPATGG